MVKNHIYNVVRDYYLEKDEALTKIRKFFTPRKRRNFPLLAGGELLQPAFEDFWRLDLCCHQETREDSSFPPPGAPTPRKRRIIPPFAGGLRAWGEEFDFPRVSDSASRPSHLIL